jgi:protein arginine kinase
VLPIDCPRFADRLGSWLQAEGPDGDVAVSCRIRLARNVDDYPFVPRLDDQRAVELAQRVRAVLDGSRIDGETWWVEMGEASPMLRLLLRERYLVSRDLAAGEPRQAPQPGRAVAFGATETLAVMVNEEDHIRLQGLAPGNDLGTAWARAEALDRIIERELPLSHTDQLGYLTSCPTNVGTGMRASVMLHLPGLSLVRPELEKVFAAAQRTGLAVRGMYGEGSRAAGDLYQISNQVTLGRSEQQLLADLGALVPAIVEFERKVRAMLVAQQRASLLDRVTRAWGLLRTARSIQSETALAHLSMVRLGGCLGLLDGLSLPELNRITVQIQKGHLQALAREGSEEELIETTERDRLRASYLRRRFAN